MKRGIADEQPEKKDNIFEGVSSDQCRARKEESTWLRIKHCDRKEVRFGPGSLQKFPK